MHLTHLVTLCHKSLKVNLHVAVHRSFENCIGVC
nr:MAG TPA: hypothetical protein [Caudoviricetes sp.]